MKRTANLTLARCTSLNLPLVMRRDSCSVASRTRKMVYNKSGNGGRVAAQAGVTLVVMVAAAAAALARRLCCSQVRRLLIVRGNDDDDKDDESCCVADKRVAEKA